MRLSPEIKNIRYIGVKLAIPGRYFVLEKPVGKIEESDGIPFIFIFNNTTWFYIRQGKSDLAPLLVKRFGKYLFFVQFHNVLLAINQVYGFSLQARNVFKVQVAEIFYMNVGFAFPI